jgi:hypothetical protein
MKNILTLMLIVVLGLKAFSQHTQKIEFEESQMQGETYSYTYISIHGKLLSKKLKVEVDFGDTPEQIKAGNEFSEKLTDKKSYAAVLNYMVDNQFELVETLDYNETYQGTGGTSGIVFIMRKKK